MFYSMCEIKTNCDDGIQKNTTTINAVILHFTPLAPAPINWMKKKKEVWKEYLSSSISEHYHLPSPRTERLFLSPSSPSSNITPTPPPPLNFQYNLFHTFMLNMSKSQVQVCRCINNSPPSSSICSPHLPISPTLATMPFFLLHPVHSAAS